MACQMGGSMYSIKVTSGKRADILNRNSKHPYKKEIIVLINIIPYYAEVMQK